MAIFFLWIVFSLIIGSAGKSRKIGSATAFFCSLLLSPLIGLIAVLASDKLSDGRVVQVVAPVSVADELAKLKQLYDTDVLTRTEYDAQKARLLGQPIPASQTDAGHNA